MRVPAVCLLAGLVSLSSCFGPTLATCRIPCVDSTDCPGSFSCNNGFCAQKGGACVAEAKDAASEPARESAPPDGGDGPEVGLPDAPDGPEMGLPDAADEVRVPGWAPSDLPGLQMWLDASDLSPGRLMRWPDKSGLGHDARALPFGMPWVVKDKPASLAVVEMVGELDYLTIDGDFSDFSAGMSLFLVVFPRVGFSPMPEQPADLTHLIEFGRTPGAHEDAVIWQRGGAADSGMGLSVYTQGETVDGFWVEEAIGNFFWQQFEVEMDASWEGGAMTGQLFRNGDPIGFGFLLSPRIVSRTANLIGGSNFRLPDGSESDGHFRGQIGEVIMYARPLEDAERKKVAAYLGARWPIR